MSVRSPVRKIADFRRVAPPAMAALSLMLGAAPSRAEAPPPPTLPPSPAAAPPGPRGPEASLSAPASSAALGLALSAARRGDAPTARNVQAAISDPVARKLIAWVLLDAGHPLPGAVDADLTGWPPHRGAEAALPAGPTPYEALHSARTSGQGRFSAARRAMSAALRRSDAASAYAAIAAHGQTPGGLAFAEGEAFAGWLALNKLANPTLAAQHFARLDASVRSPVSKARAAYWRGRAAAAQGDLRQAQEFYAAGAVHATTFYGQLAAQRAGQGRLVLARDPVISLQDVARFEAAELTKALDLLAAHGERDLLRRFALHYADGLRASVDLAQLTDRLQRLGEQELSLLAYRRGAQQGLILHERGYPLQTPPNVYGGAEPALVLAVTRQESQFDPRVRSSADARGMMQILPSTGRMVATQLGLPWTEALLWDASTNMQLGSRYLGQLSRNFQGSYVMAAAGYNAGPGRPLEWISFCGDPRDPAVDPLDFIECMPFSETRNYVMNVLANYQVYRARLAGGTALLTAEESLRRPG